MFHFSGILSFICKCACDSDHISPFVFFINYILQLNGDDKCHYASKTKVVCDANTKSAALQLEVVDQNMEELYDLTLHVSWCFSDTAIWITAIYVMLRNASKLRNQVTTCTSRKEILYQPNHNDYDVISVHKQSLKGSSCTLPVCS
jgi:hypothetical protein